MEPIWMLFIAISSATGGVIGVFILVFVRRLRLRVVELRAHDEGVAADLKRINAVIDTFSNSDNNCSVVEEKVDELQALMRTLQHTVDQANQVRKSAEEWVRRELETQAAELKAVSNGNISLSESVTVHGRKLYGLSGSFLEFRRAMEDRLDTINIARQLEAQSEKLAFLDCVPAKLDAQEAKLDGLDAVPARLDTLGGRLAELAGVPRELESQVKEIRQLPSAIQKANNLAWSKLAENLNESLNEKKRPTTTTKDVLVSLANAFGSAAAAAAFTA